MNIQWFPGHMAKTRRMIAENAKLVDVVIELLDARIPIASKNPELGSMLEQKPRIIVLNKADMADATVNEQWKQYYQQHNLPCIFVNSIQGTGLGQIKAKLQEIMKPVFEKDAAKGRVFRPIRVMVVGIPNVGKSSFINKISGRAQAETGNRPGVTKNKQWVRIGKDIELLDTPGILWPKFEDELIALHLAFTGAIKDEIMDVEELALKLVEHLCHLYPKEFQQRYQLDDETMEDTPLAIMEACAKKRGCIIRGGDYDYNRIANLLLDEFRNCKIGYFSLETPTEE